MGSSEWRTPPDVFKTWHDRYNFTVDAAATDENALVRPSGPDCWKWENCCDGVRPANVGSWCKKHGHAVGRYYTRETNGLNPENYQADDRVWLNPPYDSTLGDWVKLARDRARLGSLWVLLLPPSIDTSWFHDFIYDDRFSRPRGGVEVHFPKSRIRFLKPDGTVGESPRAGNLFAVFHPEGDAA